MIPEEKISNHSIRDTYKKRTRTGFRWSLQGDTDTMGTVIIKSDVRYAAELYRFISGTY